MGEGSNCAFLNSLLRVGVTHHHKRGQMTEISFTRVKKNAERMEPRCLPGLLPAGRWVSVFGKQATFSCKRIYYTPCVSRHLYLDACTYLALDVFLIMLPTLRGVGCLVWGTAVHWEIDWVEPTGRGLLENKMVWCGLLGWKSAPNATWASELSWARKSTADWEGREWWLVGRAEGGLGHSQCWQLHCWGLAGQKSGLLIDGLVVE